jgi:hypothetical protein|nr:hypothetical protein [Xanthomonas prunicola]
MSSPPRALSTALPPAALRAYAAAHFGKSLLWYTGQLLLIFALTDYSGLSARCGRIFDGGQMDRQRNDGAHYCTALG